MSDQQEYWTRVRSAKRKVKQAIGNGGLSHEFRSTQVYQNYTGTLGEAQFAHEDEELDDEIVEIVEEYAEKVVALHAELNGLT